MLTPEELERFSRALDPQMRALEMRIMQDIIRRIRINGEITRSADWQINRLAELGFSRRQITKILQKELNLTYKEVKLMYRQVVQLGYARSDKLYKYKGVDRLPLKDNEPLQQLLESVAAQTTEQMKNITQSLGFATRQPNGTLGWSPVADYYQNTLDGAMLDITSGAFDYNTVIKRVVSEMTNSGLRTIDYATGWKNRVDVAARRALKTGTSQLVGHINEQTAADLGTDTYEISLHGCCRPSHLFMQGRWYTEKQLETVCGLGTVTGLCGANCDHMYMPVIPGISEPTYTEDELRKTLIDETTPKDYGGKQYTPYQATQKMRQMETTMRAQRQRIKLLQDGGADEADIITARAKYRATSGQYTRFADVMGLPQERERVTVDGLGAIGRGKTTGGSDKDFPRISIGAKVTDRVTDDERKQLLRG